MGTPSPTDALSRLAFLVLAGAIGAHSVLLTGRDALFLAEISATRLPWVYLVVAGLTLVVSRVQRWIGAGLAITLVSAGVGTSLLWVALPFFGEPVLYGLYAWTGVIGAWITIQFWERLSDSMTMTDARRLFGYVASGATFGAIAGNLSSSALMFYYAQAEMLLPTAAGLYMLTAIAAHRLDRSFRSASSRHPPDPGQATLRDLRTPYVLGVAATVLFGSMALTLVDWVFKAEMAQHFDPGQLGQAFAIAYLMLNLLGAVVQVLVVQRVLKGPGVMVGISVLPVLVAISSVLGLLGISTAAAALGKLSDGALKYTLSKTATELLYVPMSGRVRRRVKNLIDVVGRKGGQALASLGILALLSMDADISVPFAVLSMLWLLAVAVVHRSYRGVFRSTLESLVVDVRGSLPSLDVRSLSALVEGLSSPNDDEVIASLTLLEHHEKTRLVPTWLLYHPSPDVVEHTLELFARSGQSRFVPIARRILDTASPRIHAAVVRALYRFDPDPEFLKHQLEQPDLATQATSVVFAEGQHWLPAEAYQERIQRILRSPDPSGTRALARTAAFVDTATTRGLLHRLMQVDDRETRVQAMAALAHRNDPDDAEIFLGALSDRALRDSAVQALEQLGASAADVLAAALEDDRWSSIRWMIPEILAHIPNLGAPILCDALKHPADGLVEYHLILALEWIRANRPEEPLARPSIQAAFRTSIDSVSAMARAAATVQQSDTPDPRQLRSMLLQLLEKKRAHAAERALRLHSLASPRENIHRVLRGLLGPNPVARASALELLDGWLPDAAGSLLRAHFDGQDARAICSACKVTVPADERGVLEDLAASRSVWLRVLAQAILEAA